MEEEKIINGGELTQEQMERGNYFTELVNSGVPFEEAEEMVATKFDIKEEVEEE